MSRILLLLLATLLPCHAEWKNGFYSARGETSGQLEKLWKDLSKADHNLEYYGNDELWIGIGTTDSDGAIDAATHPLNELGYYFEHQKHKGLVVVMFHKNAPDKKTLNDAITELNEFFFSRGYQRVILTGAHSIGTFVYSDKSQPKPKKQATKEKPKSKDNEKPGNEEKFKPTLFVGKVNDTHVVARIMGESSFQSLRKLKGSTLLNLEPECILVETFCDYIAPNKLRIHLPHDGHFTRRSKQLLGLNGSTFVLEYEPVNIPNRASKIISVSEIKDAPDVKNAEEAKPGAKKPQ